MNKFIYKQLLNLGDGNWFICNGCNKPKSKQFVGGFCEECCE